MQPIQIQYLVQHIATGRLLLPNVEGLQTIGGGRTTEQLSELELTTLMSNTNRIAAVLGHLQGVVGDLRTVQMQEQGHRIANGGSDSLAVTATQVAERALAEDFSDLTLSRVDAEMEDFGDNVNQEGSA